MTTTQELKSRPEMEKKASELESREVAESARETEWKSPSFVKELYGGRILLDLLHPYPEKPAADIEKARPFMEKLDKILAKVDGDAIDRTGDLPADIVQELKDIGAFGIKIPEKYGGLGLSQRSYVEAIAKVTSVDGSLTALLSAHQSIGLPQPLKMFGTEAQKDKWFPRLAKGTISAFALTELEAGSDPANMTTAAVSDNGDEYVINGKKLWCTNGVVADVLVVMAKTGKRISAFIVETKTPGVELVHRCHFMGLKGIQNAVIHFNDVRVPKENLLWKEGSGLKLALITLNTGRLTLPASCAAGTRRLVQICREWCKERVQWGVPIGKHDAIAQMLGNMTANAFAMETVADMASAMADQGGYDIRLEAAIAKLFNSEVSYKACDDALQIRGGRGYETADSLKARGEKPIPIERFLRDMRINRIFEGSTEIMHLFIAREMLDGHLKVAGDLVNPKATGGQKFKALLRAAGFYSWWYPTRWVGWSFAPKYSEFGELAGHLRFVSRSSRKLARTIFHSMVRFGPKLEKRQKVLARLVDIGAELVAMAMTCVRAHAMVKKDPGNQGPSELADVFCSQARLRVKELFRNVSSNADVKTYKAAQNVISGDHAWMEEGLPKV